jgi:biuret amidohydrolase
MDAISRLTTGIGHFYPKGPPRRTAIPELSPADNKIVLPKTSSGVFNSTNVDYVLKNLGVRYLIVAGIVTDQCVDMAVRDAADRGYLVSLPEDACATYSQERHDAALRAFGGYCWVTDTATVLGRLPDMSR